jgi:hypothetical protein
MSAERAHEIVEGADVALDLGGVNLSDITATAYWAKLDPARFITVGPNDVRIGEKVIRGVRLQDMLAELAKVKSPARKFGRASEGAQPPVAGKPSDRIAMDALFDGRLDARSARRWGPGRGPGPVGVDRVGDARRLWRCARRSEPAYDPHYRGGLSPTDGERDRQHGPVRRQCHRLCSQQRGPWRKIRSGSTTTSHRGDMRNCSARLDASIGSPRA